MQRTSYFLPSGLVKRRNNGLSNEDQGLFSLDRWLKKMFTRLKVAFTDDCCDAADQSALPVRFNKVTNHLQYYNPTNDTWTNVPQL